MPSAIATCDDRLHEAVAAKVAVKENHWYHAAAVSDGRTLRLYVDTLDGRGYQLRAATALPRPAPRPWAKAVTIASGASDAASRRCARPNGSRA